MQQDLPVATLSPCEGFMAVAADRSWVVDFSLGLNKRTGAFYLGRDLVLGLSDRLRSVRYWRLHRRTIPEGLPRRVLGKLMSMELEGGPIGRAAPQWPRLPGARYLHLDPLYTKKDALTAFDVVLCHDVGPLTHPQVYPGFLPDLYRSVYDRIAAIRPRMAFVSDASRDAFAEIYGTDFPRMDVVPNYMRDGIGEETAATPVAGVTGPFFLTVGEVGARKGQAAAIAGFDRAGLAARGYSYVICGPRGWGHEEVAAAAARTAGVRLLDYVSDGELAWLYAQAAAFLLPSNIEGFGIPALEAAYRGLVPIVSTDPALNEITGGHAVRVEANTPDGIAAGLERFLALTPEDRTERISTLSRFAERYTKSAFLQGWRHVLDAA
jgi:glycosyltransferase involved in cell wall biosynthesis